MLPLKSNAESSRPALKCISEGPGSGSGGAVERSAAYLLDPYLSNFHTNSMRLIITEITNLQVKLMKLCIHNRHFEKQEGFLFSLLSSSIDKVLLHFSQRLVSPSLLNIIFLIQEIIFEINYRDCALIASKNRARGPILISAIV